MSKGAHGNIYAGYRGIADIGGELLRFQDANISAKQSIEAPDMVMGDWDRDVYAYGKVEINGSMNGPLSSAGLKTLSEWAWKREDGVPSCGGNAYKDIILHYHCDESRTFNKMYPGSFGISVTAGDSATFSLELVGAAQDSSDIAWEGTLPALHTDSSKLLTWDKFQITLAAGDQNTAAINDTTVRFQSLKLDCQNNVTPHWGIGQDAATNKLFPFDVVSGLRHISGSITAFGTPKYSGADDFDDYCNGNETTMTISIADAACGGVDTDLVTKVRFHRLETPLTTGVIQSTIGFTGVTHQDGTPWA